MQCGSRSSEQRDFLSLDWATPMRFFALPVRFETGFKTIFSQLLASVSVFLFSRVRRE